jgi:Peptidase A4 family
MIGRQSGRSWTGGALSIATIIATLLCLATQASGITAPVARVSKGAVPRILSIRANRASLPSRGGTVTVTMRTLDAAGCRLFPVGEKAVTAALPRSWSNCSRGFARVTIKLGANLSGTTVTAHFRDYARRGLSATWVPLTILVRPGQIGEPAPAGSNGYTESTNWSGYVVPSSESVIQSTGGRWTVPTLNCADTPSGEVSEWVGIGGVSWPSGGNSGALLQTGTEDRCLNGVQQDDAWWELYPSNPNGSIVYSRLSVSPGDSVAASVHETVGGRWSTKIDDLTKGISGVMVTGREYGTALDDGGSTSFSMEGSTSRLSYDGGYSAEWIVEDSGASDTQLSPFANFGTVTFSNLQAGLPAWALTSSEEVELVQNGVVLSTPAAPSANGFDVRYTGP